MCFYGAYNYSGLVRQVSRFGNVREVYVVLSTAGFKGGGKPCRKTRGEASRRPRALNRVRTQAIGALALGSSPLSYPSAHVCIVYSTENTFMLSYLLTFPALYHG